MKYNLLVRIVLFIVFSWGLQVMAGDLEYNKKTIIEFEEIKAAKDNASTSTLIFNNAKSNNQSEKIESKKPLIILIAVIVASIAAMGSLLPVWGKYKEKDSRKEAPYTSFYNFDKRTEILQSIKDSLSNGQLVYSYIYKNLKYQYADKSQLSYNCYDENHRCNCVCENASIAKSSAFMALLNCDSSGGALGLNERNDYAQKAREILLDLNDNRKENFVFEMQQYRAKELIMYLQAYDYLLTVDKDYNVLSDDQIDEIRDNLADFTKQLYKHSNDGLFQGTLLRFNNLSIQVAAALGMAAIILHDRGTTLYQGNKKPDNWANDAHFYITKSLWDETVGQSKKGQIGPFADGPGYFEYAFESAIPFFISWNNFLNNKDHTGTYKEQYNNGGSLTVRNYMFNEDYDNLYKWFNNIRMPNSFPPSYDDTWQQNNFSALGIARTQKSLNERFTYDIFKPSQYKRMRLVGNTGLNLMPDYLLANIPVGKSIPVESKINYPSGDIIVRSGFNNESYGKHFLHINAENGNALNGFYQNFPVVPGVFGHEHGDGGNIIIAAGPEDVLLIDPAYTGDGHQSDICLPQNHNIVTIIDSTVQGFVRGPNPKFKDEILVKPPFFDDYYDLINLEITYHSSDHVPIAKIFREIEIIRDSFESEFPYYIVTDHVHNITGHSQWHQINLNGNGRENETSFVNINNKSFEWKHPCSKYIADSSQNFRLVANIISDSSCEFTSSDNWHGNYSAPINETNELGVGKGHVTNINSGNGKHTHVQLSKLTMPGEEAVFQTHLLPLPCQSLYTPDSFQFNSGGLMYRVVKIYNDSLPLMNLHLARTDIAIDSVLDPLKLDPSTVVKTDARNVFFSYDLNKMFRSGNCLSYCNFRKARMINGKIFKFHDTTYLESTKSLTASYSLIGKSKYRAFISTDSACTVKFYLADVLPGVEMKVSGYTFSYDTGKCIMNVDVPVGFSQFEIGLSDPCLVSCFFPSTLETVNDTFDFKTGTTETLGHKLDIVRPNGLLNITNGSHMKICTGNYLRNRDSLVLYSGCGKDTGQLSISTCKAEGSKPAYGSIIGAGGGARPSKISVMDGAVLILDDSSFTHISNNSELHVWGTFVIKAGANLQIGDGRSCSYASIFVYPGAYVHIEDESHLEFFRIIGDTIDRHIFFLSAVPGNMLVNKGVDPAIESLLFADTVITSSNVPVEICDLYTVTPAYGIANRDWGYCNVLAPKALVRVPSDTLCKGECLLIDFQASLNDPIRLLEVCRIDTIMGVPVESCFDEMRIEDNTLKQGSGESTICYKSEPHLSVFPLCDYMDSVNHWYRIKVSVKNHCAQSDQQTIYFFVTPKPQSIIVLADSNACPGTGTVKAYNYSPVNAAKAIWHVELIDTTTYQKEDQDHPRYGGDWEAFNLHYGDSFYFPGFNWVGGFKYAVSLTQESSCGSSESKWDTVEIQPGAIIMASPATVYSDPLGPGALQLNGFVGNATSFTWVPTSYLSDPYILNPIATPTDTITYILATTKGNCEAFDTLFVKYNSMAYAGYGDTVCAGESVLFGPNFDASLFIAYQYYENPTIVWDELYARLITDPSYFDKLSMYFISAEGRSVLNTLYPYTLFLSSIDRNQFYEKPWFINFFQIFHDERNYQDAFNLFKDEVDNDTSLSNYIAGNPLFQLTPFKNILDVYNSDIQNGAASQMSTSWEKYREDTTGWVSLQNWENQIKIWDSVFVSSMYKLTVIDNANNKVEYDQVYIYAHQPIMAAFYVQFQADSTLYFVNQTEPIQYTTSYHWNFGDGDTSNEIDPIHTFPLFDTSYIVTLTATNLCGNSIYADTFNVDSTGIIGGWMKRPNSNLVEKVIITRNTIQNSAGFEMIVYPNPTSGNINIRFKYENIYNYGIVELRNAVGQKLATKDFQGKIGDFVFDTQHLAPGLYSLISFIDGQRVNVQRVIKN